MIGSSPDALLMVRFWGTICPAVLVDEVVVVFITMEDKSEDILLNRPLQSEC
jgi:hypothetical protein